MTACSNSHGIARRNLVRRIERFLNALAKAGLNPDFLQFAGRIVELRLITLE